MSATSTAGYVAMLDEHTARLHLQALELLAREVERVAPSQLKRVNLCRADLVRCLQEHTSTRSGAATTYVRSTTSAGDTAHREGLGVAPARDWLTVSEAARRQGISVAWARRRAPGWGGKLVAGRWQIPAANITPTRRPTDG